MQAKLKEDRDVKDNALLADQQQRRQEVLERVQKMKEERERKKRELQEHARQVLGRHKKGSPMYKELEKQFNEQVELEDLYTKKKRL
jgi:ABC-type branched-subunit amino acid transport system ATPase component